MNLSTTRPVILVLVCVFAGLLLIALGELFLAVRENTMNMRRTLAEQHRTSRYDYGGLHVVGWLHVGLGALLFGVGTFAFLFFPIKPIFR